MNKPEIQHGLCKVPFTAAEANFLKVYSPGSELDALDWELNFKI